MKSYARAEAVTPARTSIPGIGCPVSPITLLAEPGRILLADDELDFWWDQCLADLARSGCHVDTVEDGEAGWEALQTHDYDLLITDNKMPKLWGFDLIINLRSQGIMLPIILASTLLPMVPPEQKPYFVNVDLLEKPVTPNELSKSIQHIALTHPWARQPSASVRN